MGCRTRRWCASLILRLVLSVRRELSGKSGCTATTSRRAIGGNLSTESTFGGRLVAPSAGTPDEPRLRTGDLGFIFDDELFIIGRIKDLLIVYGRNHSPDDIEATIQEITRGHCVAITVPDGHTENLVAIIELKNRSDSREDVMDRLGVIKREVTSAISNSHGLSVADLVLVPPGSIPITTSGKVRRAACVEQ
jgi:fatty acid CoA ligase FadD28